MMKAKPVAIALSAVFLAFPLVAQAQSAPAAAPTAEEAMVRYKHLVDFAYVSKVAMLPRKIEEGPLLIDSRPKARRYDTGHIPGAINIPDTSFEKMTHLLPQDKNRELIFYCQGPACDLSSKSALKAEKLGYTNIKVYDPGIPDWEAQGENASVSTDFILKILAEKMDIVLIDARPARRVANEGTIPGAINISDTNFEKEVDKLPADKMKEIIYFCQGFACDLSEKSAKKAKALGYKNVRTFAGGHPAYLAATGAQPAAGMAQAAQNMAGAMTQAAGAMAGAVAAIAIEPGKDKGSISVPSFERILKENPSQVALIDVRDAKDVKTGTFPGAINIPMNELEKKLGELPKDKPVIFVCSTGARSGEAYDTVSTLGSGIKAYFLDADVSFTPDNKYTIKGR
ncbi:MAG: rhodanese-like domain-containing protein [Rhodocyclaceae bacterium]|nr:rhodanese-like domain-containing protein [Rhodocyclaceae bacterium]MDZ4216118.1 rhodanese-like domain-containing protein [Rhodocyclaceae bacterium]